MAKNDPESPKPKAAEDDGADAPAAKKRAAQPVPIHGPDSIIDRLQPYVKQIALGGIAIFVVIGGYVTWRWMKHRGESKDTVKVAAAVDIANAKVVAADAPTPAPLPTDPKDPNANATPEKTYPTAKDRAAAAADALGAAGKAADKNGLYRAALLVDAGKLDDAKAIYQQHTGDDGLDGVLAREGVGYALEARAAAAKDATEQQRLYQQALDAYKQAQPDEKGPRRDYALYDQARMLEQLGKRAEAKQTFAQALKALPKSEIKTDIEARIAMLEGP